MCCSCRVTSSCKTLPAKMSLRRSGEMPQTEFNEDLKSTPCADSLVSIDNSAPLNTFAYRVKRLLFYKLFSHSKEMK